MNGTAPANGGPPEHALVELNGSSPTAPPALEPVTPQADQAEAVTVPAPVEEAARTPDPEAGPAPEPEPAEAVDTGPAQAPDSEPAEAVLPDPEPLPEPESEPDPAPTPEPEPLAVPLLQRGRIRRRIRYLRRLREVQLRDLGGFMVELRRFGLQRPDLVRSKVETALRTDAELRALERALGAKQPLRELREAGIGGVCTQCGAVHGSADRFCSTCGATLSSAPESDDADPR